MLRRLALWSGRRIAVIWLIVLVVEGALFLASHRAHPRSHRGGAFAGAASSPSTWEQLPLARRDSLLALVHATLRPADSVGEARRLEVLTALTRQNPPPTARARDSLMRLLDIPAALSGAQRDSLKQEAAALVGPIFGALSDAVNTPAWRAMALVAITIVYGPILLVLILTASWFVARSQHGTSGSPAPVA